MKLGFVSDSLAHLPLDGLLDAAVASYVQRVEINTGGCSSAPRFDLTETKASARCAPHSAAPSKAAASGATRSEPVLTTQFQGLATRLASA